MTSAQRVTYATLTSDNEDLHRSYEAGAVVAGGLLGREITGHRAPRSTKSTLHEVTGPHDPSVVISRVRESTAADVADGIATAKAASLRWATTDWRERVAILDRVADLISDRVYELAALMSLENGKNRLEALGDVEEAADMIRYYCTQMVDNNGYNHPMGTIVDTERTRSVLKPYGVWAVIAPFNFPAALSAGPTGAALVTGNTVVLKPSLTGAFTAAKLFECFTEAGLPPDVAVLLPGGDRSAKPSSTTNASAASRSPGRHRPGSTSSTDSAATTRSRSWRKRVERTRQSFRPTPTSTPRHWEWHGRLSVTPVKNVRHVRGSTSTRRCTTTSSRDSWRRPGA